MEVTVSLLEFSLDNSHRFRLERICMIVVYIKQFLSVLYYICSAIRVHGSTVCEAYVAIPLSLPFHGASILLMRRQGDFMIGLCIIEYVPPSPKCQDTFPIRALVLFEVAKNIEAFTLFSISDTGRNSLFLSMVLSMIVRNSKCSSS
jgi:hypothetical protein